LEGRTQSQDLVKSLGQPGKLKLTEEGADSSWRHQKKQDLPICPAFVAGSAKKLKKLFPAHSVRGKREGGLVERKSYSRPLRWGKRTKVPGGS